MLVAGIERRQTPDYDELSAEIGGFRLWYRVTPGVVSTPSADSFVAAALFAAMARHEPLELDPGETVSPRLRAGLESIQEVFAAWQPALKRVPVIARIGAPAPARPGVGSFFSGGVDSLYSFLEKADEVTHLIQIHGFEYKRQNRSLVEEAERRNREFVERKGCRLVVVESNFRDFYESHRLNIFLYHGAVLGSIALSLGFSRVYIPASHTWSTLFPWGSHPVTDPLWGNGAVEIVHHGTAVGRIDKLDRLGRDPAALELLRVCPSNTVYNCGRCEKCLRTRSALRLLSLHSPNFAPLKTTWPIYRLSLGKEPQRTHWTECYSRAVATGDRRLARAAAAGFARADARRLVVALDRALFGARLRGLVALLRRATRRDPPEPPWIGTEPPPV